MKVVVLGGSSGMGFAIAKSLHERGHEVVIASRSKEKLAHAQKAMPKAKTFAFDVTKEHEVSALFSSIGAFDHLIITAADFVMGPFLEMKTEEVKRFFDSKFWGQYCAAKYAAPHIRKGGSITFFCGIAGKKPMMHFAAGAAINAGIEGLTRALALELAPLRVNAIAPGTVVTPVWNDVPEKERLFEELAEKLPVKRVGKPEDFAPAAHFLIECGYVTGTVLYIDGGDHLI